MKRRVLNTEAVTLIDNRASGVRQTVKVQVLTAGTVFISTQQNDLQQLSGGIPVNGLRLVQANSIQDGTFTDFLGVLYARSDVGVDVEVEIFNSPPQFNTGAKPLKTTYTPWNAPRFGGGD